MVDRVFSYYSRPIKDAYAVFIENTFCKNSNRLDGLLDFYKKYAALDSNFPRPILTYLGINAKANELQDISKFKDIQLLFIPQLMRDFLAIHDDIIDEDLVKFKCDTLPFSFSKIIEPNSIRMNKWGKDVAMLLADMQLSAPLEIISDLTVDAKTKVELFHLVSDILRTTNKGQIDELLLNNIPLESITTSEIVNMYKNKAADYCYAFPLTLGMVYSGINNNMIADMRAIMLNLGFYSQIINDFEGVFYEHFSNERNTISDLMMLRRTYLLVKFYHSTNIETKNILNQPCLSKEQANIIKHELINSKTITEIKKEIENGCKKLEEDILSSEIGDVLKNYLLGLVNKRIIANLSKI